MLVHVLRFKFKDSVSEADKTTQLAALQTLADVPSVAFSVIGQDLGDGSEDYTHAFSAGWENIEGMVEYLDNPAHPGVVSEFMTYIEKITFVDFSNDLSQELKDKMNKLREERAHKPDPG